MKDLIDGPIQGFINSVTSDENTIYAGIGDYRIALYDKSNFELKTQVGDLWEVKCVSVDENYIYGASLSEDVKIYSKESKELIANLPHELGVIQVRNDSKYIYTSSYNREVFAWNKSDFKFAFSLSGHNEKVAAIEIDDNGSVFTGDGFRQGGIIRQFNSSDRSLVKEYDPKTKNVKCLHYRNGTLFSGHAGPNSIIKWNIETGEQEISINLPTSPDWIDGNDKIIAVSVGFQILIYDLNGELITRIGNKGNEVRCCRVDNKYVIYGDQNLIRVLDVLSLELLTTIDPKSRTY